jgi:phage shock protein C
MSTAAIAQSETGHNVADEGSVALPLRADTFLGVCEAIGQDLGINPNWLRIAFAPFIMLNPLLTIAVYLGLGAVVALSRWFFPAGRKAQPALANERREEREEAEERLAA